MKGYKAAHDMIKNLKPGETCVIIGFRDHFDIHANENGDVAKEMLRQSKTIPPQLQEYFSAYCMIAQNYRGNVIRLPHYELCAKVKYHDRNTVSYDDIMRAFATSLTYKSTYPNWIPDAAWNPHNSRKNEPKPEYSAIIDGGNLNKRFPEKGGFFAYITTDRGYALEHCDEVDAIGIKVRKSETSKLSAYEIDPYSDVCVFFNNRWKYTDSYIINALREAYKRAYDDQKFTKTPVTVFKAQNLVNPIAFGLKAK